MLDTLANSGAEIDDTPFILKAQEAMRAIQSAVERGIAAGEITEGQAFDRDYKLIEGSNPAQYQNGFCEFADANVRDILDRFKGGDNRIIGSAITDVNGYLPTHLSERSHAPGPDPVWNDAHCRNKRIFMDDTTRNAINSNKPAMLATYRMELATSISRSRTCSCLCGTSADLATGDTIEVRLPEMGATRAKVVWRDGYMFGCQFEHPIPKAAVSAALLHSDPRRRGHDRAKVEQNLNDLLRAPTAHRGSDTRLHVHGRHNRITAVLVAGLVLGGLVYLVLTGGMATLLAIAAVLSLLVSLLVLGVFGF